MVVKKGWHHQHNGLMPPSVLSKLTCASKHSGGSVRSVQKLISFCVIHRVFAFYLRLSKALYKGKGNPMRSMLNLTDSIH
jgi:hypothetical protein